MQADPTDGVHVDKAHVGGGEDRRREAIKGGRRAALAQWPPRGRPGDTQFDGAPPRATLSLVQAPEMNKVLEFHSSFRGF